MINRFINQYKFLDNFFVSPFVDENGVNYLTVEHYFQAHKACNKKDFSKIIKSKGPKEAKNIGNSIQLKKDWDNLRDDVMLTGIKFKFKSNNLKIRLLNTKDEYLEEGNYHHDNYWGNCLCKKCKNIKGVNRLGKLLMKLRRELQNA